MSHLLVGSGVWMRHGGGNVLKWQTCCEYLRVPPLNSVECATRHVRGGAGPRQHGGGRLEASPQSSYWVVVLPLAVKAIWEKWECAVAPCQCFSSAGMWTTSPTVISCCVVSVAIMPVPSVTNRT